MITPAHLLIPVDANGEGPVEPDQAHHRECWCACPHSGDATLTDLAARTRAMARLLVETGHATSMLSVRIEEMLSEVYGL